MSEIIVHTDRGEKYLSDTPDKCPFCHKSIMSNAIYGNINNSSLEVLFSCPATNCGKCFIGYYSFNPNYSSQQFLNRTTQGILNIKTFSNKIEEISKDFSIIYNQAFAAEQQELMEICGVGYRKALEFLIKDYAIKKQPGKREQIEKNQLASVINEFLTDVNIRSVAKRAVWLGNDETHYVRKWEGKDLTDLKKLIDLTVHWIEMEVLTASFQEEMPG